MAVDDDGVDGLCCRTVDSSSDEDGADDDDDELDGALDVDAASCCIILLPRDMVAKLSPAL